MGAISAGDQTLLRNQIAPQYTTERLYSFGFPTMWSGLVNDSTITRGERSIVYDTGSLASGFVFGDIVAGLEVWFGTSAGAKDLGRRRLRSISGVEASGTMVVDWYDDISLSDGDNITIVHVFAPWPKFSYFTSSGPTFRKDGPDGDTYTDENETPPPLVVSGRHYANELPAAGTLQVQLNAASSQAVASGASITTYLWDVVPSGPTISNTAIANPTITFTGEGRWWVSCTVTDDNGNSSTGYRAYRIGGGITEFSRGPYTSQFDDVEVNLNFTITSPSVTWADFDDRALIILTGDDWYGTTNKTITFRNTAVYTDHEHIMYAGYLSLENDDLTEEGVGQFQMTAISTLPMYLYSLSLTGETSITDWYEMSSTLMTVAGNLFHLFKYHSTLLDIMDWWLPWTDTTKRSANELFTAGNLLEKARALIRSRLMAMTATPQGEVFVEANLNLQDSTTRAAETTTLTLADTDIANVKRVRVRRRGEVVRVLLSGGSSSGLLGTFVPYLSASHDVARAEGRPSVPSYDTLMLASQTEANDFAGRLAQVANATYQEVNLDFSGNYREVFSPADQQWTNLGTVIGSSQTANLRANTDLESALCIPRQVTVNPPQNGFASINVIFEIEAPAGITGVALPQPTVPSDDIADTDFDPPDPPAWPQPEPPTTVPFTSTGTLFSFDDTNGCYIRRATDSDWSARNGSLSGADIQDEQGGFDPWWHVKTGSYNVENSIILKCDTAKIFRSADGGTTWVDVTPTDDPPNVWDDSPAPTVADLVFIQRVDNIHTGNQHIFLAKHSSANRGWLLKTADDCVTWQWSAIVTNPVDALQDWTFVPSGAYSTFISTSGGPLGTGVIQNNGDSFSITSVPGFDSPGGNAIEVLAVVVEAFRISQIGDTNMLTLPSGAAGGTLTISTGLPIAAQGAEARGSVLPCGNIIDTSAVGTNGTKNNRLLMIWWHQAAHGQFSLSLSIDTAPTACITPNGAIPIWMDVDTQDGTILWLTYWSNNELHLQKRQTTDLAIVATYSLGAATEAEFNAKTYIAYPFTPAFDNNTVFVYGRMNAPQSLANPEHLIKTDDGGSTWSSVINTLGSDYIGALQAWEFGEAGVDWEIIFVRNVIAGSTGEFWRGINAPIYKSDTTFQVNQDALTVKDSDFAIGAIAAVSSQAINVSTDGGATWADATDSHPAGSSGEIKSLVYV